MTVDIVNSLEGIDWAQAKARQILATHQPDPLDPKLSAELGRIIGSLEK